VRINDAGGDQALVVALERQDGPPGVLVVHTTGLGAESSLHVFDRLALAPDLELIGVTDQPDEMAADIVGVEWLARLFNYRLYHHHALGCERSDADATNYEIRN
jgi:hypothetical protein